jgi:hypothetical protein
MNMTDGNYRGWSIWVGRYPEPQYMAQSPDYDAWTDDGEWADNGLKASSNSIADLHAIIDGIIEENTRA